MHYANNKQRNKEGVKAAELVKQSKMHSRIQRIFENAWFKPPLPLTKAYCICWSSSFLFHPRLPLTHPWSTTVTASLAISGSFLGSAKSLAAWTSMGLAFTEVKRTCWDIIQRHAGTKKVHFHVAFCDVLSISHCSCADLTTEDNRSLKCVKTSATILMSWAKLGLSAG